MTIYKLLEVLDSQYNRKDEKRHNRSVLFLIQNTVTGHQSLYEIDRISKHTASLRCNARQCGSRLSIEHDIKKLFIESFFDVFPLTSCPLKMFMTYFLNTDKNKKISILD